MRIFILAGLLCCRSNRLCGTMSSLSCTSWAKEQHSNEMPQGWCGALVGLHCLSVVCLLMPPQAKLQRSTAQPSAAQRSAAHLGHFCTALSTSFSESQHSKGQLSSSMAPRPLQSLYLIAFLYRRVFHTARRWGPNVLIGDHALPAHLQAVEKEATAMSDINLPSTFRSPCTRFGPQRASSLPTHPDSRSSSPDFLTLLGQHFPLPVLLLLPVL